MGVQTHILKSVKSGGQIVKSGPMGKTCQGMMLLSIDMPVKVNHIDKVGPTHFSLMDGNTEDVIKHPLLERTSNALICTLSIQHFSVLHDTNIRVNQH